MQPLLKPVGGIKTDMGVSNAVPQTLIFLADITKTAIEESLTSFQACRSFNRRRTQGKIGKPVFSRRLKLNMLI